jgi:glyoxylase-like metal-dependent hydrolase (beta-lactamase superfamily II)
LHDIASTLDNTNELGIRSKHIEAIIWSHNHFDHTGDPSTFPPTTDLVVGPGVSAASWPGWPSNADGSVLDSDMEGRVVREITFDSKDEKTLKIGRFDAMDYFGDGSFYLLDAPGHTIGHLCALARTTADPPSFVFLGADACHHPGALRPTDYLPLPSYVSIFPAKDEKNSVIFKCPGEMLQELTIGKSASNPFFEVGRTPLFPDHDAAMDTIGKIQELDASDDVFVLIAHDLSLRDRIPLFPKTINSWRANDLGRKTRWVFCNEFPIKDA